MFRLRSASMCQLNGYACSCLKEFYFNEWNDKLLKFRGFNRIKKYKPENSLVKKLQKNSTVTYGWCIIVLLNVYQENQVL